METAPAFGEWVENRDEEEGVTVDFEVEFTPAHKRKEVLKRKKRESKYMKFIDSVLGKEFVDV